MISRLADAVGPVHYVFVSSISVYSNMSQPGTVETDTAPPATDDQLARAVKVDPAVCATADPYGADYGPLKRSCEIAARQAFGGNSTLIRLGLIVGPGDYTDRFTWWVRRCDAGGTLPVPEPRDRLIQLVDVRDAADFMLHLAEKRVGGTLNVTGDTIHFDDMLSAIMQETGATPKLHYLPLTTFTDAGYQPWTDLPLILPDKPSAKHMLNVSTTRARQVGLASRPLSQTIRDTLCWDRTRRDIPLQCGLSAADEGQLLR